MSEADERYWRPFRSYGKTQCSPTQALLLNLEIMQSMSKESFDLSGQSTWTECDSDWLRGLHIELPAESRSVPASLPGYLGMALFTTGVAFQGVWMIAFLVKMWD